jgi:NAD(P) transhydrogenase subunit beta
LSNPETSRRGNIYGIIGMSVAFIATAAAKVSNYPLLLAVIVPGVIIGAI